MRRAAHPAAMFALLLIALLCCGDGSLHGGGVGQIVVRAGVR